MSSVPAETVVSTSLAEPAATWLRNALDTLADAGTEADAFLTLWSRAGRRLGQLPVALSRAEETGLSFSPQGWGADEYGRALLLLAALRRAPIDTHVSLVEDLFRRGELREQRAVLRVLAYLPAPGRHAGVGVDAVRSNATSVIEAIACDNPFPGAYFPDDAYAQMVLKCLFCGLRLERVEGLALRLTPELKRMVAAYASERRAAGRPVPADAALVLEGDSDAPV